MDAAGTDNSTDVILRVSLTTISQLVIKPLPLELYHYHRWYWSDYSFCCRSALGVDAAGTDNSTDVSLATVADNYLSISDQTITAGTVPLSLGGTGATTASAARSALGVDAAGTDNSTDVSLATVANNYLTISDQTITAGTVPLSLGGTGATSASAARTALGVDAAGTDNSTDVSLYVTGNYLSISDQTITAGTVPLSLGGTGATTASAARSALGVDAAGTDNSTDVSL